MKALLTLFCLATVLLGCGGSPTPTAAQLAALKSVEDGAILIDVRSPEEVASGSFEDALKIVHTAIVPQVAALGIEKDQPVVLFCRSGNRSGKAADALRAKGYTNVINAGGYESLAVARASANKY